MADMMQKYNTKLVGDEEDEFQKWAVDNGRTQDQRDYDMRGWWKENKDKPVPTGGAHFTDKFKKPSHPTFSTESQYSGKDGYVGGKWEDKGGGKWAFTPSKTNLKNMPADQMKQYFDQTEGPDVELKLPKTKAQKRYGMQP
jgi:hypothetical protein